MRVIGTAGHVDHGKSTLVKALTGINPDRLKEEQAREMTIDLGFAWLTLPSGESVSLVDVPGHEAFIKNMLAGVGGIDAALLVVAADEGVMPQTREHLAILDLLQVKGGVVALTKSDLEFEPGWLDLIQAELEKTLAGTVLAGAPIVRVSAKTGAGLDTLTRELERTLAGVHAKADRARPRLPVDRVFTLTGFGTVVTGTLSDGAFNIGDEVEIVPRNLRARVRGIQTHKKKITRAEPGTRAALNLANVEKDDIARGDTIILPGTYASTQLVDARLQWLASAPKPLAHHQELELFVFASQIPARVRLLEGERIEPGASGLAQVVLAAPALVAKGDRFILRYASPSITVGGGVVIDPHPRTRYRRQRAEVLARLGQAERGTPDELIMQFVAARGVTDARDLAAQLGLDEADVSTARRDLLERGELIPLTRDEPPLVLTRAQWLTRRAQFEKLLDEYHRQFPLRVGMPREEFKSRVNLPPRAFDAALERAAQEQTLQFNEKYVWRAGFQATFSRELSARVEPLLQAFARAPYTPPSTADAEAQVGAEALNALIEQGKLIRINAQVLFAPEAERTLREGVVSAIRARGQITAAELRDEFKTSRKYAVAFLEYLDAKKITRRVGDARVLRETGGDAR